MAEAAEKPVLTTGAKVFVVVAILLALANLIDFIFYDQQLQDLASGSGFALMAYGTCRNARLASTIGLFLAIGAIAMKYLSR